jgi:zinc and cadmium transporter
MLTTVLYTIGSVIIVSLVSLVGIFTLALKEKSLQNMLMILVSVSAGTLLGGALLHLLPEAVKEAGSFSMQISLLVLLGVLLFFILEKFIHHKHEHGHGVELAHRHKDHHPKHIAPINIIGDALHNLLDGLVIAGSYLVSIPAGIATTVAVVLHEVPQEVADFGVLVYSGMSKTRALFYNFLTAAVSIIGAIIGLVLGVRTELFISIILPIAAGGFLYIAGSNLIPELHKDCRFRESIWHIIAMVFGMAIMVGLLFLE